VYKSRIPKEGE
jgi:putative transposase